MSDNRPDSGFSRAPVRRRDLLRASALLAAPPFLLRPGLARGQERDKTTLRIGYQPDVTALPLFAAQAIDAFSANGLDVRTDSFNSAAEIQQALDDRKLDAAILPFGQALVAVLDSNRLTRQQLLIPCVTQLGGAAFCASTEFYDRLAEADQDAMVAPRPTSARAIASLIASGNIRGDQRLRLGVSQKNSMEAFLLRYWLAAGGVDPADHIEFVEQSGPFLVASLRARAIDGFFAVEPWPGQAVAAGYGRVMLSAQEIWGNAPMAALVTNLGFVEQNPGSLSNLIRGLIAGGAWCDPLDSRSRAIRLLAREETLNLPEEVGGGTLAEGYRYIRELGIEPFPDYAVFHRYICNYPWLSDGLWFLSQMVRWGQIKQPIDLRRVTQGVMRPDLYRNAVIDGEQPLPRQEYRIEGSFFAPHIVEDATEPFVMGSDAFIDGGSFDPSRLSEYIDGFEISEIALDMIAFGELNG